MLKGFVTQDNIYYESIDKLSSTDTEVPIRRASSPPLVSATVAPPQFYQNVNSNPNQYAYNQNQSKEEKAMFNNIGWKDLITFIYFLCGVATLWINMSERTLILEQRFTSVEKEQASLREMIKETGGKFEGPVKNLEKSMNEIRIELYRLSPSTARP